MGNGDKAISSCLNEEKEKKKIKETSSEERKETKANISCDSVTAD